MHVSLSSCLKIGAQTVRPTKQEACTVSQQPAQQQQRIHPYEKSCQSVRGLARGQEKVSLRKLKGFPYNSLLNMQLTNKTHGKIRYMICVPAFVCRDFLNSLRLYRTYYGGLADQLCVSELATGEGLSCWNGTETVKRFVSKRSIFRMATNSIGKKSLIETGHNCQPPEHL